MGRQISSICRGLLRQITGSDVNGQRSTKDICKKTKRQQNYALFVSHIYLQSSKYLQSFLGLGILLGIYCVQNGGITTSSKTAIDHYRFTRSDEKVEI